jgi:hypothetical protein
MSEEKSGPTPKAANTKASSDEQSINAPEVSKSKIASKYSRPAEQDSIGKWKELQMTTVQAQILNEMAAQMDDSPLKGRKRRTGLW